jgi:hypothetical protein
MKIFVIHLVKNSLKIPKVKWGLFDDDNVEGQFYRCSCGCRTITLDAIKCQSFHKRFFCLLHEVYHYIFDLFPEKIGSFLDFCLDITHGNSPELIYEEVDECFVLYTW